MAETLGNRLTLRGPVVLIGLIAIVTLAVVGSPRGPLHALAGSQSPSGQSADEQDVTDVLGANAACLVCHQTFLKEELARTHQLKGVSCTKCHGASIAHANDEHVGATKPDISYLRDKVDPACASCHDRHDVPARKVIQRFLDRKLPARPATICTDCHGAHRIDKEK